MKKTMLVVIVLLAALFAGTAFFMNKNDAAKSADGGSPSANGKPPQQVSVLALQPRRISNQQSLPGRVKAYQQAEVRPQVDGIITQRLFEEGSQVAKGQQLYQIDDARFKALLDSANADLQSANANLQSAQARFNRYKNLVKSNAVSEQEFEDAAAELSKAQAGVAVAQADVQLAQVNLAYTKVYAPIAGQVSRSFVTDGTLVTANQTQALTMITQLNPVYVDMQQPISDLGMTVVRKRMAQNNTIAVRLNLHDGINDKNVNANRKVPSYEHEGKLQFSEVTVNEATSSVVIRALFPNPDAVLLPGTYVRAVLDLGARDVLLVPQRATTRTADGRLKVWLVDATGKAQERIIEASQAYEDQWILDEGLAAGDQVIVEGYQKVKADTPVAATPLESAHR